MLDVAGVRFAIDPIADADDCPTCGQRGHGIDDGTTTWREELPHVIDAWDGAPRAHRYGEKIRREVDRIRRAKFKKAKPSKKGTKR